MILLEGCDLCGKTTLAKSLRQAMPGWSYRGHTRPPLACGFSVYQYFSWFLADTHPRVICDRLHLSNVYQSIYTPEHTLSDAEWRLIELACLKLKTRIIYLQDTEDNILSRWRKDEMYDSSSVSKLLSGYENFISRTHLPVFRLNLSNIMSVQNGKEVLMLDPLDLHTSELEAIESSRLPPPSIGSGTTGGILYIGESISDNQIIKNYVGQLPFSYGPASDFLWEALDKANIPWWWGYYTNADDIQDIHNVIKYVKPQRIVALGKKSENFLKYNLPAYFYNGNDSCTVSAVRHPQAARRFGGTHETAIHDYAHELLSAVGTISGNVVWGRQDESSK